MPASVKKLIEKTWANEVKDANGKSLFSGTM
jgi:hypothetical protein